MKIIPILGLATRVSKKNPQKIDYLGLYGRCSLFNFESTKAKTRRIVGYLKQIEAIEPDSLPLVYGINPKKLDYIKSYKELPSFAVTQADTFSKPCSLADSIKGLLAHLRDKIDGRS